jgi:hypothetical protein
MEALFEESNSTESATSVSSFRVYDNDIMVIDNAGLNDTKGRSEQFLIDQTNYLQNMLAKNSN